MDFALSEVENWQLLNRKKSLKYIFSETRISPDDYLSHFVSSALWSKVLPWEDLKQSNFTPIIQWLKRRINLYKLYTGSALSLSVDIIDFKVVFLIDPITESREIRDWLINHLNRVSSELSSPLTF